MFEYTALFVEKNINQSGNHVHLSLSWFAPNANYSFISMKSINILHSNCLWCVTYNDSFGSQYDLEIQCQCRKKVNFVSSNHNLNLAYQFCLRLFIFGTLIAYGMFWRILSDKGLRRWVRHKTK